jgi:transposase-like protein
LSRSWVLLVNGRSQLAYQYFNALRQLVAEPNRLGNRQCRGYRFPPEIIEQAIWLYVRFTLSFRDVEDLLAECGIVVSYETVRRFAHHNRSSRSQLAVV